MIECFLARENGEPRSATYFVYEVNGQVYQGSLLARSFAQAGPTNPPGGVRQWLETWAPIGLRTGPERERPWRGVHIETHARSPGEFFPRMWRPFCCPPLNLLAGHAAIDSLMAASDLTKMLRDLFLTVEPDVRTHAVYGHEIRNLLLLACTEVETQWAGVLTANCYAGDRWKTSDYVALLRPMELDQYVVSLRWFEYPDFKPFGAWDPAAPTKTIPWYEAYNLTKHDRAEHFNKATLERVIQAFGALVVLLHAQLGPLLALRNVDQYLGPMQEAIESVFEVRHLDPGGTLSMSDLYVPPPNPQTDWKSVNYPFPTK
jgi:hypothetical protein